MRWPSSFVAAMFRSRTASPFNGRPRTENQADCKALAALGRASGRFCSMSSSRTTASSEMPLQWAKISTRCPSTASSKRIVSCSLREQNSSREAGRYRKGSLPPLSSSKSVTPMDHTSVLGPGSSRLSRASVISGEQYLGSPSLNSVCWSIREASEKSAMTTPGMPKGLLAEKAFIISMLSGLMSL